jgi:beta-glucosidase
LDPADVNAVMAMKNAGLPVVVVVLSGRPVILDKIVEQADAIVAAWLPGSEGQGVADVLFGDYQPTGKLSFAWPRSMSQIPRQPGGTAESPLYPFNHGLSY